MLWRWYRQQQQQQLSSKAAATRCCEIQSCAKFTGFCIARMTVYPPPLPPSPLLPPSPSIQQLQQLQQLPALALSANVGVCWVARPSGTYIDGGRTGKRRLSAIVGRQLNTGVFAALRQLSPWWERRLCATTSNTTLFLAQENKCGVTTAENTLDKA
jgi:hypothetical protein